MINRAKQYQLVDLLKHKGFIKSYKIQTYKEDVLYKELLIKYDSSRFFDEQKELRLYLQIIDEPHIDRLVNKDGCLCLDFCYVPDTLSLSINNTKNVHTISARYAYFEKELIIGNIQVYGFVDFTGAMFNDNVRFEDVFLGNKMVDFSLAQFKKEISFKYSNINGDLVFHRANIKMALFKDSVFRKSLIFDQVTAESLLFEKCDLHGTELAKLSMDVYETEKVWFKDCNICLNQKYNIGTVKGYYFNSCFLEKNIEFSHSGNILYGVGMLLFDENTKCYGKIISDWGMIKSAIEKSDLYNLKHYYSMNDNLFRLTELDTYTSMCNTLSIFKENYRSLGYYDWEDEVYVEFKRYECKRLEYEISQSRDNHLKNRIKICLSKLLDLIGCYGTKPTRVAFTMFVVFIIFSGLFTLCFLPDTKNIQWWSGFYFSGITFLTIGYGVITPLGMIESLFAVIEGFIGMFLMSYFSVAVVRKTLR